MKILELSDILSRSFAITDVSVIYQTNLWSVCNHLDGRIYNGFLLIKEGSCKYEWGGRCADVGEGTLIYLPTGSRHRVSAKEQSLNFYRINFTLTDLYDGERVVFSDEPLIICSDAPRALFDTCERMIGASLSKDGVLKNLGGISEILDFSAHTAKRCDTRRIAPAISYLDNRYTEEVEVADLAAMCYMSEAHFFRLFKRETGTSPIDYKNALRINKACELLLDMECSVSDVSSLVGFDNLCYFTRVFKKEVGLTPTEYRRRKA